MLHEGAGVAARAAFHAERQREAERLHQQFITNEFPPEAFEAEVDIIFINPDDIEVPLWHGSYASVNPREKKSARRVRQQAVAAGGGGGGSSTSRRRAHPGHCRSALQVRAQR